MDLYDYNKYHTVFGPGSPLAEIGTGNPVLTTDNCNRYAYWLTEHQKEKITLQEDFSERYPPWGNQIFPLVGYCTEIGKFDKSLINGMTKWEFSLVRQGMPGLPSESEGDSMSEFPKTDSTSSQACAELFDKIHEEFKNTPCPCCNPPPGEPVCEPVGFDTVLASNKDFRDSGCEFTYKDWVHLTGDIETASWVMYPSYFNIDMLKTNLSKEIPISVSYRGYDECMSFHVVIKNHEGKRPIVAERTYKNICSVNEQKEYRLPLYKTQLTDHGKPIILPKGNYQLLLYKIMEGQVIDDESDYIGQFYFSSHFDDNTQSEKSGYDYTKPSSEVLRDTRCAEWFDRIMQTGKSLDEEFGLKYELTETNVFRDLNCAKFVAEWESLTEHDVWGIGISWEEIASIHED